jgi:hypothetical protein
MDVKRCEVCGALTKKWEEDLASVPIPKVPRHDVSYSHDCVLIVNHRFKELIDINGISGMGFRPIQRNLYAARPIITVAFDFVRRGTRFLNRCESCGEYESVVGATPVILMPGEVVPDNGFARTDIEFASNDEKHPIVLCGDHVARTLRKTKLRGVDLELVKDVVRR